jgi:hypothetical protein
MKYLNKFFELIALDGCKHIILSAVMAVVLNIFLPAWAAGLIALAVGVAKEYVDHYHDGQVDVKDLLCDLMGVLIGVL